jgi:hypothetical protein
MMRALVVRDMDRGTIRTPLDWIDDPVVRRFVALLLEVSPGLAPAVAVSLVVEALDEGTDPSAVRQQTRTPGSVTGGFQWGRDYSQPSAAELHAAWEAELAAREAGTDEDDSTPPTRPGDSSPRSTPTNSSTI